MSTTRLLNHLGVVLHLRLICVRPSASVSAAHQTVMHLIKRLFHVRRIKESAAHVPLHSNHQHAASELQTMLGRCVFKADGADWSHKDKCTGQTRAEVWLVTLGQTHTRTHTVSRWHFVVVA